jgi:hypothetical protein
LVFYLSFSLFLSLSFSSANIYIHKSLNCNSKSRLIAAEVTELLMGISRGKEKEKKKEKRRATTTKKIEIYYALCSILQVCMQNFAAKPQHRVHTHDTYIIASF